MNRDQRQEELSKLRHAWNEGKESGGTAAFDIERTIAARAADSNAISLASRVARRGGGSAGGQGDTLQSSFF
ncbi:hypothetical protein [Niveispirillum sp. BGYR6]|uniref:hypothetical protein n=1 Tax=Niveispirillum sp. BGYR6 TaxID=2971249 RepID=UPI0022B95161|nr:hypothetical protein [Niveispirillum sp. BGYR6]MDG5496655.1 hypothetical protein [Niveispirillum sp. BGYR6]